MPTNDIQLFPDLSKANAFVLLNIIMEWCSIRDQTVLTMACNHNRTLQWPIFFEKNNRGVDLVDRFIQKATTLDYTWLLSKHMKEGYSNHILSEKIKTALLENLNDPNADLEFRLRALRVLSDDNVRLPIAEVPVLDQPKDALFYLLADTLPIIQTKKQDEELFKRLSDNLHLCINRLEMSRNPGIADFHQAALALDFIAHKLDPEEVKKNIQALFRLYDAHYSAASIAAALITHSFDMLRIGPQARCFLSLLSLLAIKFQVKTEPLGQLSFRLLDSTNFTQGSPIPSRSLRSFIEPIFFAFQFIGQRADYNALTQSVLKILEKRAGSISKGYLAVLCDALELLSSYDQDLMAQAIDELCLLASNPGYDGSKKSAAITALARLASKYTLEEARRQQLIQIGLTEIESETWSMSYPSSAGLLASLWHHLEEAQREKLRHLFFDEMAHHDHRRRDGILLAVRFIWPHFTKNEREHATTAAMLIRPENGMGILHRGLREAMAVCLPEITKDQLPQAIKSLTVILNRTYGDVRYRSDPPDETTLKILSAYIWRFPEYDYQFNELKDPAAKVYLFSVVAMTRAALNPPLKNTNNKHLGF